MIFKSLTMSQTIFSLWEMNNNIDKSNAIFSFSGDYFEAYKIYLYRAGGHTIIFSTLVLPYQMVFKSLPDRRHQLSPGNLKGHEKPDEGEVLKEIIKESESVPEEVVDDLDSTEDGEASEKTHGAPYQTQLGFHCHL